MIPQTRFLFLLATLTAGCSKDTPAPDQDTSEDEEPTACKFLTEDIADGMLGDAQKGSPSGGFCVWEQVSEPAYTCVASMEDEGSNAVGRKPSVEQTMPGTAVPGLGEGAIMWERREGGLVNIGPSLMFWSGPYEVAISCADVVTSERLIEGAKKMAAKIR